MKVYMSRRDKPADWFSCRHETAAEYHAAVAAYKAKHGPDARRTRARSRALVREELTPQQQLKLLEKRPGLSRRERLRLEAVIASAKN